MPGGRGVLDAYPVCVGNLGHAAGEEPGARVLEVARKAKQCSVARVCGAVAMGWIGAWWVRGAGRVARVVCDEDVGAPSCRRLCAAKRKK